MLKVKLHIDHPVKQKELGFWLLESMSFDEWNKDGPSEVQRIKEIFLSKGYEITLEDSWRLWCIHSNDWCASWLYLDKEDQQIWDVLKEFWVEDESK